jgi:uncharacterized protein YkwD
MQFYKHFGNQDGCRFWSRFGDLSSMRLASHKSTSTDSLSRQDGLIVIMIFTRRRVIATLKTIPEELSEHFLSDTGNCSNDKASRSTRSLWSGKNSRQQDHHLVNEARDNHGLGRLQRTVQLDEMAQAHANSMAQRQSVYHSVNSVNALRNKLRSNHVGENILRGKSILKMHNEIMSQPRSFLRSNILCHTFDEMGMGTALGKDGQVYLVQLFRSTHV